MDFGLCGGEGIIDDKVIGGPQLDPSQALALHREPGANVERIDGLTRAVTSWKPQTTASASTLVRLRQREKRKR